MARWQLAGQETRYQFEGEFSHPIQELFDALNDKVEAVYGRGAFYHLDGGISRSTPLARGDTLSLWPRNGEIEGIEFGPGRNSITPRYPSVFYDGVEGIGLRIEGHEYFIWRRPQTH